MRSSYLENDFGQLLYLYILNWRPIRCVELGVLDGYSTLHIARGVKDLQEIYKENSTFHAYDLFDQYQYKHGDKDEVEKMLAAQGVGDYVEVRKGSAYEVADKYADGTIEFLHIDISNTGKVVRDLLEIWHPKIAPRGLVCIEGGSEERDRVPWMVEHNAPPIKPEINSNVIWNRYYIYGTYFKFPSMTVGLRKWWDVDAELAK